MFRFILFCIFVSIGVTCYALPINVITTTTVTSDKYGYIEADHDSLAPVFKTEKYVPQYDGHKDRYDAELLKNDPEVLVSNSVVVNSNVYPMYTMDKVLSIRELDSLVRSIVYDPKPKTANDSKTPAQVLTTNLGNCYEVAQLARTYLKKSGFETKLVNLKIGNSADWHTICVFKELDGTWSLFQAGGNGFMGYTKGNVLIPQQLFNNVFGGVSDYEFLKS